jgi:hypothetical protein
MEEVIDHKCTQKWNRQNKKLEWLKRKIKPTKTTTHVRRIPDIVQNLSSHSFSKTESDLLENGLNYAIHQKQSNLEEIVVDVESCIKVLQYVEKENIRREVGAKLKAHISKPIGGFEEEKEAIALLKEEDCFFLKADKGNSAVVLDKSDYIARVEKLLDEGPYEKLELPRMKRETLACLSALVPDSKLRWRLRVTKSQVPRLYALPKIHKPGGKMRPIVSNISAAHENIAKWLVPEFESMQPLEGLYVKNTFEFADKIKNVYIMQYDILVSFDVEALFPSIPVDEALELVKK